MSKAANPPISALLTGVTWLEVVILFWAGCGLLFYPPAMQPFWPWSLAPFNLRFLGALYAAAMIAALLQAVSGRWSPARVVTPMIFIFTLVVTVFSLVHLERFDLSRVEAWIWFVLYVGVCLNAGVHLWLYRKYPLPQPALYPRGALRGLLRVAVLALGAYGLLLLIAPIAASAFWPWQLDAFHAQLYSVTFLTPALGAWVLLRGATRSDLRTLGLTLAAWGVLPILGLILADANIKRIRWDAAETIAWLALFGLMGVLGAWLSRAGKVEAAN